MIATVWYGPESISAGESYLNYGHESGKPTNVNSIKKVYELHCEDNRLDFDTEWEKYNKAKEVKAERNGKFKDPDRRTTLVARFAAAFGDIQGADVVEFKGWKARLKGKTAYIDPCGRIFPSLPLLQAWLGYCMESGLEDRVRELIESARVTADPAAFSESKKAAAEQEDNTYSVVKNPLEDGESGDLFASVEPRAKKARQEDEGGERATFDTEFDNYNQRQKDKQQRDAEENGIFNDPNRRNELLQSFVEVFGALKGPAVVEFKGWKTRWTYTPTPSGSKSLRGKVGLIRIMFYQCF